jgi:hypothetical protein
MRPRASRAALSGMDGADQLRAALDDVRRRTGMWAEMVVVNNGRRGPNIIDTRGMEGGWVVEGLIPTGVIAALADLDDPPPSTLLENGFDVVVLMEARGAAEPGEPVLHRVYFHPRLGLEPPAPFKACVDGTDWERA